MSLSKYENFLKRSKLEISCARCDLSLLPKGYRRHLVDEHGYNLKNICPWCLKFSYENNNEELKMATHRMQCLTKLISRKQDVIEFRKKLQCRYCNESLLPRNMSEHVETCHVDEAQQCIFCGAGVCDWSCVGMRSDRKFSCELKKKYQDKCKKLTMLVECRECDAKILPLKYGYHVKGVHAHNEFRCIWCNTNDESLEIDYVHRIECMMSWYEHHREMKNPEEILLPERNIFANVAINDCTSSRLFLNCEECDTWYRGGPDASVYTAELPDGFTDPIDNTEGIVEKIMTSLKNHDDIMVSNEIEFIPESGLDARWIALYLSGKMKFYHLMIRQQVFIFFWLNDKISNGYISGMEKIF
jgi:hypothetical protein